MQRKNYILKRRGIAMIMAIAVILILSTIMALMLSLTAQSSKQTTNDYLHEQAIILTRSAIEYALLQISARDRTTGCLTRLNLGYPNLDPSTRIFDINMSISYIGLSGGNANSECTPAENFITTANVSNIESRGAILLDVIISTNPDSNITTEPIRYHRRTLQKL